MEKLIKINVILIIFMLIAFLSPSILLAITRENSPLYLGITPLMEESQMGYAIGNPQNEGNGMKIINIVKYSSATSNDPTPMDAFCLKADTGFTNNRSTLNVSYNMKTQRDEIKQQNELLRNLVEATITEENGTQISRYNALLAAVDMLYLPRKSDEAQKQEIIKTVKKIARQEGTYDSTLETYPLTDDDITAIQQAVIWYFTNYGERNGKYDKLTNIDWLYYTLNGSDYYKLCEYNPNGLNPRYDAGQARSKQVEILYKYMISQAKERASQYGTTTQNVAPATVTTQKLTYKAEGQNYIIGPIHINKNTGSSAFYSIDFVVKNNQAEINNYTLLNEQQKPTETGTTIKDLVGKDFYLSVPESSAQAIAIDINIKYDSKTLTLWADTNNNQEQPVLVPTIKKENLPTTLTVEPKELDLALRKYITKVNDLELTQEKTRVPNIEERALTSGTTAEYKHKKDPVEVKTGDKVTYKLTIYNEGEKVGRATKVVDQLPTGLKFVRVVGGNFEVVSYEEGTNTLNLARKTDNTTNLPSYTEGSLTSGAGTETIEIECQVTQEQGETQKILTNVAWIAEQIDGETGEIITTQEGKDRDSEPQTKPEVNKDNMENYTGNNNKEELNDKDYYYKGQQDDDDFEKLIIQPIQEPDKTMDLALRKYITKINEVELTEEKTRVPNIEERALTSGTTAEYKHKKDPVEVKTGDKVTYKLTIYNEGEKVGRATKVVDQLPTGLKFVRVVGGNFEIASYEQETNTLNLARKTDNTTNLPSYTEGSLTSGAGTETIEIECQVTQEQGATGKVLTNVAWIAEQIDGETGEVITTQEGKDRDSEPQTKPEVNKDNMENYTGNDNKEGLNDKDYYYKGQQDDDDFEKLILPKAEGMYDLKLVKVDEQDNNQKLKGAEFNITLADGTKQTITTNENGTIDINAITITQEGTDTITIEETKAPEGYYRLINSVTLKVTKQLVNGSYTITSVVLENNRVQGVQVTMEQNTAKLTVPNKKIQGSYQLQLTKVDKQNTNKKLAGSQFRVTLADGTQKDLTTDENGILQIPDINITKTGMDTITLEEIQAPSQYDKIVGKILLEVTKTVNKDKYMVSQVAIKENNKQATATVENNTVKVVVTNQKTPADFKLIKAITQVNQEEVPQRIEKVDVSKLNTVDEKGILITTGEYKLNKEPISVKTGDIVTYTFRVYNEGMIDGYVQEITEDVPEGLQFLWSDKQGEELQTQTNLTETEKEAISFNQKYLWGKFVYDEAQNIKQISSTYLAKENEKTAGENLIPAFGTNDGTKTEKDIAYKEIAVKFKVIAENELGVIRNEAAITQDANQNGEPVEDRDSDTEEWKKYEDDEDYDNIILKQFDLALRKFIIAVGNTTNIQESDYLKKQDGSYTREPVVDTSKLNTQKEDGSYITTATYHHIKEPITVQRNNIIIYMLRVYNEGDIDGYASEIKDHLPSNLAFVEGEFNQKYGWKVSEDGRTVTTKYLADKIIEKTKTENAQIVLAYQEVPIMCQVKESAITNENITNIADISEYLDESKNPIKDRDSESNNVNLPEDSNLPNYKGDETESYIPGQQDDDDFEKILVREFDLALRKWVTQAIVIENGKETINQTGHDPWDDPEGIVKVELHRKKLDKVTVKFRYSIRVYNQGDIEGYAKEITDYIPEGLKFIPEENQGWTVKENNIITTNQLANTLLKPGEFADVEVLLTWKNAQDNIGLKTNIAEISEDYNEYGLPDKDSTPNNKKQGEDDIDDAPVMLSISTGRLKTYVILGMVILLTLGSGVFLIKKYVL